MSFTQICIIYNPSSTSGNAQRLASRLYKRLTKKGLTSVMLNATEYAGHAEELAYQITMRYKRPLLVSVSGDGGYNEVINGTLRAQDEDPSRQPTCALLPAGNANDHHRATHKQRLTLAILKGKQEAVDVLRLRTLDKNINVSRYAHSYIGLGITSEAAINLNREKLSRLKELRIVSRIILKFSYFTIKEPDGAIRELDSLVFANIHTMSKVLRLGSKTELHNGLFRVITLPHHNVIYRIAFSLKVLLFGLKARYSTAAYEFSLPKSQLVHFDGEVTKIPGGAHVRVEAVPERLMIVR